MTLPGDLTTITITGTYGSVAAGAAASGSVSIAPSSILADATGQIVLTQVPAIAALNSSGSFTLGPVPCTDNQTISPLGFAYTITVAVGGAQQTIYPVYLPHTLGSTVDISKLTPGGTTLIPSGLFYLPNAASAPSATSAGGGFLYCLGGALFWQGPSGEPTLIAPA